MDSLFDTTKLVDDAIKSWIKDNWQLLVVGTELLIIVIVIILSWLKY